MVRGADASLERMKIIFAILLTAALGLASAQVPENTYRVRPGESLAAIAAALVAQEAVPGSEKPSVAQRMVAIYRANPKAFAGSMNQLLDGSELRLPSAAEIAAVNPALARLELADQTPNNTAPLAQASDEEVIAGLQKALRRKERELAVLRAELEGRREPLTVPGDRSNAAVPAPVAGKVSGTVLGNVLGTAAGPDSDRAKVGEGSGASAVPSATGQVARGLMSPSGLAVAGTVALLGGFGLLWYLRGRDRVGDGVTGVSPVTSEADSVENSVAEVRTASVVEAEVLQRMPDLSGFSGLGSATPRTRDPNS